MMKCIIHVRQGDEIKKVQTVLDLNFARHSFIFLVFGQIVHIQFGTEIFQ